MVEMINQIKIGPDERTSKCSSDKSCGSEKVNYPRHTHIELSNCIKNLFRQSFRTIFKESYEIFFFNGEIIFRAKN